MSSIFSKRLSRHFQAEARANAASLLLVTLCSSPAWAEPAAADKHQNQKGYEYHYNEADTVTGNQLKPQEGLYQDPRSLPREKIELPCDTVEECQLMGNPYQAPTPEPADDLPSPAEIRSRKTEVRWSRDAKKAGKIQTVRVKWDAGLLGQMKDERQDKGAWNRNYGMGIQASTQWLRFRPTAPDLRGPFYLDIPSSLTTLEATASILAHDDKTITGKGKIKFVAAGKGIKLAQNCEYFFGFTAAGNIQNNMGTRNNLESFAGIGTSNELWCGNLEKVLLRVSLPGTVGGVFDDRNQKLGLSSQPSIALHLANDSVRVKTGAQFTSSFTSSSNGNTDTIIGVQGNIDVAIPGSNKIFGGDSKIRTGAEFGYERIRHPEAEGTPNDQIRFVNIFAGGVF